MDMIRVGILGMVGVLFAIHLKQQKPEYSYFITTGICIEIFLISLGCLDNFLKQLSGLQFLIKGNDHYFKILLKVIGITYICEFCSNICSDAGYKSISSQIEMFGKITILLSGMPILLALLNAMCGFAGG